MPSSVPPTVVVTENPLPVRRHWGRWTVIILLVFALAVSLLGNAWLSFQHSLYYAGNQPPAERFREGNPGSTAKIARISIQGTISPPFTGRILKALKRAKEDPEVRGVLVIIDSPGGLVADSHEIYHRLQEISKTKPLTFSMRRLAASGGLYVAMGGGPQAKIFAEPTTWTGSIGVIIPRYDISGLGEKIGVKSDSLKTGEFKDTLNPLRPMTPRETELWRVIMADAFDRFIGVIASNRPGLNLEQVKSLATGQIFTAEQAQKNGLVDQIGYEEDALASLKEQLKLKEVRVIEYHFPIGLIDLVAPTVEAVDPEARLHAALDRATPQPYYHCAVQNLLIELPALHFP